MGRNDWFRRKTWTKADQDAFIARLNRSRSAAKKAQYLRIQALSLQSVGTEEMLRASIALLNQFFEEYPDAFDLAQAYLQKAECLLALGDESGATEYFRSALEVERERSSVQTTASLKFGWLVVERDLRDLYDEALQAIETNTEPGRMIFPYEHYMVNAVRAVITEERGYHEIARELAQRALDAASQTDSGFRYHPNVGLVRDTENPVHARLVQIAGGS